MKVFTSQQLFFEHNGHPGFIPSGTEIAAAKAIAGGGTGKVLLFAPKLAELYGGPLEDWSKMIGKVESDQFIFDVHWYEISGKSQCMYKIKSMSQKRRTVK